MTGFKCTVVFKGKVVIFPLSSC